VWLRLLLGLLLGYLAYRVVRRIREMFTLTGGTRQAPRVPEPDVLVQDPVCQTFIPRQEALKFTKDGHDYFFCSEGCLKRFRRGGGAKTLKE
jgi:YHS domain-containing protein